MRDSEWNKWTGKPNRRKTTNRTKRVNHKDIARGKIFSRGYPDRFTKKPPTKHDQWGRGKEGR